jgi:hypothetical protein
MYNTYIATKEQEMQALINLAIVLLPIIVMGLALILKGEF